MPTPKPDSETIKKLIRHCNEQLITDWDFDPSAQHHVDYFIEQFDYLEDKNLRDQLGDAFYQARLLYTMMSAMNLTMSKNKGFLKFQIIQYASICEALLNYSIERYFKEDFETTNAANNYKPVEALSSKTKISYEGAALLLCKTKKEPAKVTFTSNPIKSNYACQKNIISAETNAKYQELYKLRNNTHLLKAATAKYYPNPKEAKEAYTLTWAFIKEVKSYILAH